MVLNDPNAIFHWNFIFENLKFRSFQEKLSNIIQHLTQYFQFYSKLKITKITFYIWKNIQGDKRMVNQIL